MKRLLFVAVMNLSLSASELSNLKEREFKLREQKSRVESEILENSWINSLNLSTTLDRSKSSKGESISLSLSQDIFRSGGILYLIEYAKLSRALNLSQIDIERLQSIYQIYNLSLEIEKVELSIKMQDILIENAKIDISVKEEQYESGVIDISYLDEAIIELNSLINQKESLKESKEELKRELKYLSDKSYSEIKLNELTIPSIDSFLERNFLNIKKEAIELKKLAIEIQEREFLPKLSINSSLNYDNNLRDSENYRFMLTLSVPIDFDYKRKIESKKLDYMIERVSLEQSVREEREFYRSTLAKIDSIERKISNSQTIINRYSSLIEQVKELYKNGLKTKEDLEIIQNRQVSKEIEIEIFKLDREIEILNLLKRAEPFNS